MPWRPEDARRYQGREYEPTSVSITDHFSPPPAAAPSCPFELAAAGGFFVITLDIGPADS
jgi:hypothetical protein